MFKKVLPWVVGGGAFLQQISQKDVQSAGATFTNYSNTQKAQFLGADVVYRLFGINLAPTVLTNPGPWGVNPKGIFNKWTGTGLGLAAYAALAPKGAPMKSLAKKLGGTLIVAGATSGFFDNPPAQTSLGTGPQIASYRNSMNNAGGMSGLSG